MNELKEKVLVNGDKVYFDWRDSKAPTFGQSLGRAEFIICLAWNKRKKKSYLERFFIYHAQQRDVKNFYRVEANGSDSFSAQSWSHKGMEPPKIWFHFYCHEHKGESFRLYVPENSKSFTISTLSTAGINFDIE